jgi:beta-lactamase superfamily II metal-dependent hydrolase
VADTDNEDLSGLPSNIERFKPRHVLWAGNTNGTRAARDLWSQFINSSIPVDMMQEGQALDLGNGSSLMVLSSNEQGAVLLLEWEDFRMLLPMGMDFESMGEILSYSSMRNISAIYLSESGYAPLNPPEFISSLNPQLALLSVAAADRNGLPSSETIQALEGYNLLRTDLNGWINLTTDGKQMWVEVEKR